MVCMPGDLIQGNKTTFSINSAYISISVAFSFEKPGIKV